MFRASFEPNANLRSATARADSLPDAAMPRFHRAAAAAAAVAAVAVVVGKKVSEARFICLRLRWRFKAAERERERGARDARLGS